MIKVGLKEKVIVAFLDPSIEKQLKRHECNFESNREDERLRLVANDWFWFKAAKRIELEKSSRSEGGF